MAYVIAMPDVMTAAATNVAAIGSTVNAAHLAAAAPTVAVIPAAADEVSASIAHLFSTHAQGFQALAGKAAVFQDQFVQHLNASAHSYAAAEGANAVSLQPLIATAAAAAGAAATLPTQISDMLTSFWNGLTTFIQIILALPFVIAFLAALATFLSLLFTLFTLLVGILLVQFQLLISFGVYIPLPFLP